VSATNDRTPAYRDEAGRVYNAAGLPLDWLPLSKQWIPDISDRRWELALLEADLTFRLSLGYLTKETVERVLAEAKADENYFEYDWKDGRPNPKSRFYEQTLRSARGIADIVESAPEDEEGA
jgi:hypothetical protein